MLDRQRPYGGPVIMQDQITREERMRAVEPYPSYYDRRVRQARIIGGAMASALLVAEYLGLDTKFVNAVVDNVGPAVAPAAIGTIAGTRHYVTRKDF